jgi:hypothetical protein
MAGAGADLACRGWGCVHAPLVSGVHGNGIVVLGSLVNKQGHVRSGVAVVFHASRGEAEREKNDRWQPSPMPSIYPKQCELQRRFLLWLGVGCEVQKVSSSERVG